MSTRAYRLGRQHKARGFKDVRADFLPDEARESYEAGYYDGED